MVRDGQWTIGTLTRRQMGASRFGGWEHLLLTADECAGTGGGGPVVVTGLGRDQ